MLRCEPDLGDPILGDPILGDPIYASGSCLLLAISLRGDPRARG